MSEKNPPIILNATQKQAVHLLARGYSKITAAHVLGINQNTIEEWSIRNDFKRELSTLSGEAVSIRRF